MPLVEADFLWRHVLQGDDDDSESASNQKMGKFGFVKKQHLELTFQKQFIQKNAYQVVHEPDFGTTQPLRDPNALGSSTCTSSRCSCRPGGHGILTATMA